MDQQQKYAAFRALHEGDEAFVMANAWDAGTARILDSLGFAALGTTSAGYAFAQGKRDSNAALTRQEILNNAAAIVAATELPVSADLEDGFGVSPEACFETIRQAAVAGLAGGSIEDATGDDTAPLYPMEQAAERVRAAAEAANDLPILLTGRAENFICGNPDLQDTIRRLQVYGDAGADVLYAPGLPDLGAIETVCRNVDKPVNVVMGLQGAVWSVEELSRAGAKRISVGGSFARAALGALVRAGREVIGQGTFSYAGRAFPDADIRALMSGARPKQRG